MTSCDAARRDQPIRVNSLGDLDPSENCDGRYLLDERVTGAVARGDIDIISQTVGTIGDNPDSHEIAIQSIDRYDKLIADNASYLMRIMSYPDIGRAKAEGKLGFIYNFQDTVCLRGDPANVDFFYERGVRIVQLTYNRRNLAGHGCLEPHDGGIAEFGRSIIARLEALKMVLDLSHAGPRTIAEGIAQSKAPPMISHSGCRDLADLPRNTFDREIRALADKGGLFGVYLMPFLSTRGAATREDLLRHLTHAVDVAGEDHVCIGTDNPFLGFACDEEDRRRQRDFYDDRLKQGIVAPGEAPDVLNMIAGYNGTDRFNAVAEDLTAVGWTASRIDKLLGGNFVRFLQDAWGD